MSWNYSEGSLKRNIYLYDESEQDGDKRLEKISGVLKDFKDVSYGKTALGSSILGKYQLNGYLEQFIYSKNKLRDEEIESLYEDNEVLNKTIIYTYDGKENISRYPKSMIWR